MNSPREKQLQIKLLDRINFAKHFHTKCPVTSPWRHSGWRQGGYVSWAWLDFPKAFPRYIYPGKHPWLRQTEERKPPMIFNVVNVEGFSITKAREPIRFLHLTPTWHRKKLLFNGFLSFCWEKDWCWHGRFHVKM